MPQEHHNHAHTLPELDRWVHNLIDPEEQKLASTIRSGLGTRWGNLSKAEAELFAVFELDWSDIMLDYEEFSTLPTEADRLDKLEKVLTASGERGKRAISEIQHQKKPTTSALMMKELRTW